MEKLYYTYILECADGTFYTGYTTNLENRVLVHNIGLGSKYTRLRLPVSICYSETFKTKSEAMKREYQIKQLTRSQKLKLINQK